MLPSAKSTVPGFDQGRIQCSELARPLAAEQSRSHRIRIFLRQAIRRVRVQYVLLTPANRPICETQASRLAWQGTCTATRAEQPAMWARGGHTPTLAVWAAGTTLASGQALADLGASARFAKTAGRSGNLRRLSSASQHIGLSSLCDMIA